MSDYYPPAVWGEECLLYTNDTEPNRATTLGVQFDVYAKEHLIIKTMGILYDGRGDTEIRVFYRQGTHTSGGQHNNNKKQWTEIAKQPMAECEGQVQIRLPNFHIPVAMMAGCTASFAITSNVTRSICVKPGTSKKTARLVNDHLVVIERFRH